MADTKKGLEGAVAAQTKISEIDGKQGKLNYAGYEIQDLAEHSTFEEVVYLLHHAELPGPGALAEVQATLAKEQRLDERQIGIAAALGERAHPMTVLRTVVSASEAFDPDSGDGSPEATLRKSYRLVAQVPQIVAAAHRLRTGQEVLTPPEGSVAAGFLYAFHGTEPDPASVRALDKVFVLYADHTLNASTFAARVAAATLADVHASVTAAIGALQGVLHGGAIEGAWNDLQEVGSPDRAPEWVRGKFAAKQKVMGFGHRVYKTWDPRSLVLKELAREATDRAGHPEWFQISTGIQEAVRAEKDLYPNVDFYTGNIYSAMGIPADLFTAMFAISRTAGWTAHIREQYADNRLIRPASEYIGPAPRPWLPPSQRRAG